MYLEKVDIIENFWIIWVFKYGIILTPLLGIFMVLFIYRLFRNLDLSTRLILTFVFLMTASGNNSLATNTTAINIITMACIVGFDAFAPEKEEEEEPIYEEDLHSYSGV
jgi:hypothetical protein